MKGQRRKKRSRRAREIVDPDQLLASGARRSGGGPSVSRDVDADALLMAGSKKKASRPSKLNRSQIKRVMNGLRSRVQGCFESTGSVAR